jgi:hypothetical protein
MLKLKARTSEGTHTIFVPQSWDEVTVEQFQKLVKDYDGNDWIKLFAILSNQPYSSIHQSTDNKLETTIYQTIEYFLYNKMEFEALPLPKFVMFNSRQIEIPRKLGKLTIGQNIQARQSLSEMKDLKEGISIMTAIYLQPLIDKKPFDHVRAIEIEQDVLKMSIVSIFPIGFFLLKKIQRSGRKRMIDLSLMKRKVIKSVGSLLRWLNRKSSKRMKI